MKIDYDQDLPCGVCRDLIPLVRDGVACADSRRLVEAHTAHSPRCACMGLFFMGAVRV